MEQVFAYHNPKKTSPPFQHHVSLRFRKWPMSTWLQKPDTWEPVDIYFSFSQTQTHPPVLLILYLKYTLYCSIAFFSSHVPLSFQTPSSLAWTRQESLRGHPLPSCPSPYSPGHTAALSSFLKYRFDSDFSCFKHFNDFSLHIKSQRIIMAHKTCSLSNFIPILTPVSWPSVGSRTGQALSQLSALVLAVPAGLS